MINRLRITNFRGVKEGTLELSPITILLGPNNSGKSTILEALFLAPNPCRKVPYFFVGLHPPEQALNIVYFLHKTLDYQGYAFLLHNYTSKYSEIVCDINGDEYSLRFINAEPYIYLTTNRIRENFSIVRINGEEIGFFARIPFSGLSPDVYDAGPFMNEALLMSPNLIKMGYEYFRQRWTPIINARITKRVAEDASKFSHESYRDLTMEPVIGGQLDIHAYLNDGRRIRLGDLGEGIQSYVVSKILYEIAKPDTLLWDDIESHLNPRILIHLADWFSELLKDGKQVILSTHSLEVTKVIAGVNEEETGIYLTSLEDSTLRTRKLTLSEVENLQEAGIDARTAEALLL